MDTQTNQSEPSVETRLVQLSRLLKTALMPGGNPAAVISMVTGQLDQIALEVQKPRRVIIAIREHPKAVDGFMADGSVELVITSMDNLSLHRSPKIAPDAVDEMFSVALPTIQALSAVIAIAEAQEAAGA